METGYDDVAVILNTVQFVVRCSLFSFVSDMHDENSIWRGEQIG
jgi:hypothetical protein